ncbi:hypothetical protein [Nocardia rhamnosiphila]
MKATETPDRGYVPLEPSAFQPEWESKTGGAPMTARAALKLESPVPAQGDRRQQSAE